MTIRYILTTLLFLFGGGHGLVACQETLSSTEILPLITAQLSWTHNAQFAGFYAAAPSDDWAFSGIFMSQKARAAE